jgi:hypothetical protein
MCLRSAEMRTSVSPCRKLVSCDTVKPHPVAYPSTVESRRVNPTQSAAAQGLTLVHFSAQRKRFLWDRGCM